MLLRLPEARDAEHTLPCCAVELPEDRLWRQRLGVQRVALDERDQLGGRKLGCRQQRKQ